MSQIDGFIREQSASESTHGRQSTGLNRSSINNRSSMMRSSAQKKDPYALDFEALRQKYVKDTSVVIPFVKSSFIHYSKCPRKMKINEKSYNDLVITMELIQAPKHLKYSMLDDPAKARENEKKRRREEAIQKKKAELRAAKQAKKDEIKAEIERKKQEKLAAKQAKKEARELAKAQRASKKEERRKAKASARINSDGSGTEESGSGSATESEEDDDESDDVTESEEEEEEDEDESDLDLDDLDLDDLDLDDLGLSDFDESEEESPGSEEDDSGSGSMDDSSGMEGEDREYTGDMFADKANPVKFVASQFNALGEDNDELGTNDSCCISIWSSTGPTMRFVRLKDTTLRVPPLQNDQKFRVGHDAKRLYYIGKKDGKNCLVIVWLKDLTHQFIDLGDHADKIETLEGSSLFKNYLCYAVREKKFTKSKKQKQFRWVKNFFVMDIRKQKIVWELPECEYVFFKGQNAAKLEEVEFEEVMTKLRDPDEKVEDFEDSGDESEDGPKLRCKDEDSEELENDSDSDWDHERKLEWLHKGIMVVKSSIEEVTIQEEKKPDKEAEEGKDGAPKPEEEKKQPADDAADADKDEKKEKKKVTRRYIRAYYPQWRKKADKSKRLYYETFTEVKQVPAIAGKETQLLQTSEGKSGADPEANATEIEENQLIITSDCDLFILAIITLGMKGEQHKVDLFNPEKKEPLITSNRAGNTRLEYNMNSHIRKFNQIFICQTESNSSVTAKRLQFVPEDEDNAKIPVIQFTRPERGYAKDCWLIWEPGAHEEEDEPIQVMAVVKSSTDEYLNADCMQWTKKGDEESAAKFEITMKSTKIRAQEIDLNYPCLVSNIGLSRIVIQSLTSPDQVSSFKLDERDQEFICFADYQQDADIGFKDKRDEIVQANVPFGETGDKIAFLTRHFKKDDYGDNEYGDMYLNVLSIDSYSSPMRFELYTTNYEACMGEGMSDDAIQKCFVTQITSVRGLDVAFIAQYNDRIIYDCITSTKQLPIRFPMPRHQKEAEEWKKTDPDFDKEEAEFEQMDICKGGQMVRQQMFMDVNGAIYFMMKYGKDVIRVLRTDPTVEMGDDNFVKTVFQLRSTLIYFCIKQQDFFYIMDDQKKIRVLEANKETNMWKQKTTLELPEKDANTIVYTDFDEYCISEGCLHTNDKLFFLIESKSMDNPTWAQEDMMQENHLHVSGPRYATESGLIWYMEKHANLKDDNQNDDFFGMGGDPFSTGQFKGYSVVMQPLGDLSYMDLLPQRGENNSNFITFLSDSAILVNYSGRYLIFDLKGHFLGQVKFMGQNDGFRSDQIRLVNVSDSQKFFVFEGPHFLTRKQKEDKKKEKKEKKQKEKEEAAKAKLDGGDGKKKGHLDEQLEKEKEKKKQEKNHSGGKKAPRFYIFKLQTETTLDGRQNYRFMPFETQLYPFIEFEVKQSLTQRINHLGEMSQCMIKSARTDDTEREMEIIVKNYKSKDLGKKEEVQDRGFFSFGGTTEESPDSEERYRIKFAVESFNDKKEVLSGKIAKAQKLVNLGHGNKQALARLQKRNTSIERAWVFDNFLIIKCGAEIKYMPREKSVLGLYATEAIKFEITLGAEVWIENCFPTGIEDLVQFLVIDDANNRVYIITWNLQNNREHSLFQSKYAPEVFPENLVLRGAGYLKQQDFNYFMDNGAIINLESNLPVQFFDMENEADTMPIGYLGELVEGMRRISSDNSRYLDVTKPGRMHHFISFVDLLYWERFQMLKEKHEIQNGVLSTFSPIARFPEGVSVFHTFATNVKVLTAVQDAFQIAKQEAAFSTDSRMNMLPLVFLHSNPMINKPGKKTTPIHIALDKQSPIAFETMFALLVDQRKVCVTSQLLDVLEAIINMQSQSVNDFFENSFYITDQYDGLRALQWDDVNSEEKILATSCAYLTDEFMQSLVSKTANDEDEEEAPEPGFIDQALDMLKDNDDAPLKYSTQVEPQTYGADDSNLKQVEAKILDFNWVFIGDNAARMMEILSSTDNDEIFACAQIRVFVDFMWQGYYDAIFSQLFLPFIFYFLSFILYTGFFSHHEENELSTQFICEIVCLVIFGKTFVTFLILEMIQIKNRGLSYFTDVWNLIDIGSLGTNAAYVYCEITNAVDHNTLQVIAAVALFMMWFKLFYWMRLFKPFSAFIRMITEIIKDIQVFLVMLIIALGSFANVIYVLNLNRIDSCEAGLECSPIYDSLVMVAPIDAMIHAYLTGLGDFGKDNYSSGNAQIVWFMFIIATIVIQLIFMNLLIAIMGESFSRITAIMQQSTLKELCAIMEDHIWLQKIDELFEGSRYILWLTPDTSTTGGTVVERQLQQLKDQIKNRSDQQEQRILRAINNLNLGDQGSAGDGSAVEKAVVQLRDQLAERTDLSEKAIIREIKNKDNEAILDAINELKEEIANMKK